MIYNAELHDALFLLPPPPSSDKILCDINDKHRDDNSSSPTTTMASIPPSANRGRRQQHPKKSSSSSPTASSTTRYKRRYCRVAECTNIVKSQGLCQRHGAKTRKCKVEGCDKQAQGNFDHMCKSHFKEFRLELKGEPLPEAQISQPPPPPEGESVYDRILPESMTYMPRVGGGKDDVVPLVSFLKAGFDESRPRGWHRNQERRARGLWPVSNPAAQLEGWERELVWLETCILSGSPQASFRHLARGWGRDKGFHMVLAQYICERRGDVERKKRPKGEKLKRKRSRSSKEMMDFDLLDFDEMDGPLDLLDIVHHSDYDLDVSSHSAAKKAATYRPVATDPSE